MGGGAIDEWDLKLAERDPNNSLDKRAMRVLDEEITALERQIKRLQFVREAIERRAVAELK